jgi:hypothetical protein
LWKPLSQCGLATSICYDEILKVSGGPACGISSDSRSRMQNVTFRQRDSVLRAPYLPGWLDNWRVRRKTWQASKSERIDSSQSCDMA